MPDYRERLWPSAWIYIAPLLLIPASILTLAPVSLPAGIVTGVILYGATAGALTITSPTIEIGDGMLRAGRAEIAVEHTGHAVASFDADARAETGVRLDARAYLVIRGWVKPVVRIPIVDADDPVPYWLVSSRRASELAAAVDAARLGSTGAGADRP
ncbi:hypothetical protein BJ978_002811 [Agromyces terreus]|uniref:DUF3093 domain-containing protein n=1 Tax=Agromyces terreus TaxID=424795 RepID=A0A9X2GZR1_9MICO|nr:DUF3093 domain-containing protein [Agromyces terreus]MCP2372135.1 hypothetical protein [Agromyces terreus]